MSAAPESIVAIVLAAGQSERMGGEDKLWADLGGRPLLEWSLRALGALPEMTSLVVVTSHDRFGDVEQLAEGLAAPLVCAEGGAARRQSVAAGVAAAADAGWYLVHDGARPLVSTDLARRVLEAARIHGAAAPGLPVADTIKRVNEVGLVVETPPRGQLRAVQTPQAFRGDVLRRAHAEHRSGAHEPTDDAAMVEALGEPVAIVQGDPAALKVTTPDDLTRVRAMILNAAQGGSERGGV